MNSYSVSGYVLLALLCLVGDRSRQLTLWWSVSLGVTLLQLLRVTVWQPHCFTCRHYTECAKLQSYIEMWSLIELLMLLVNYILPATSYFLVSHLSFIMSPLVFVCFLCLVFCCQIVGMHCLYHKTIYAFCGHWSARSVGNVFCIITK